MFRFLDKLILWLFRVKSEEEVNYAETRDKVSQIKHILYDMDIIDSKSSALLTHVSLMIAVLIGLMIVGLGEEHYFIRLLLRVEIVIYIIIAMFLLRCVDIMGPPFRKLKTISKVVNIEYHKEVLLRRTIYQSMLRIVFLLTALLVLAAAFKYFIDYPS